jgi:hypothetical protein
VQSWSASHYDACSFPTESIYCTEASESSAKAVRASRGR